MIYFYIIIMAAVTYLIRMIPLTVFQKKITNPFLKSFLYYVPYACLSAMTFPAVLYATDSVISAAAGVAAAMLLAFFGKGLVTVAVASAAVVFLTQQFVVPCQAEEAESSKDGRTYYEIFVRSFYDSDGDGIGDIRGVTEKLDYIEDMGFNGIWLMPVMPSATYHKYDVIDYYDIDKEYGTLDDMKELFDEADKRGISVILDFVFNHTSDQNTWFTEACSYIEGLKDARPDSDECPYFEYYNFAEEPGNGGWYQVGDTAWYYEAQFWSGMPDLNLDSSLVRQEITQISDYWMELGADGFRLDAAKEYFTGNTTKNVEILKWYSDYIYGKYPEAYLVAEVWDSLDVIAEYYSSGIDSIFDYTFGNSDGQIIKKINQAGNTKAGGAFGRNLQKVQELYLENNPKAIDAPFLSNHDTGRISSFLGYDEDKTKFAGAMNLFMSGNAFVYYGEELGMTGAGKDENKRAPMYWSADESSQGMTCPPPDMEPQEHRFGDLEQQEQDSNSVLNYYKKAIEIRNEYPAIASGVFRSLSDTITDGDICAVEKTYEDQTLYCIYNFSKEEKTVDISSLGEVALAEILCTETDQEAVLTDGEIIMPAYGAAILKPVNEAAAE